MKNITDQIRDKAVEIIKERAGGIRYSELVREVLNRDSSFKENTVHGSVYNLDDKMPQIEKPSRGLYVYIGDDAVPQTELPKSLREEDFYQPFADFLQNDLEDVTKAIGLGGSRFKDKWGTPDVIGKREAAPSDIVKPPIEIVSAEIKTNTTQLITAFGQACAYCLFSHRSYLVVPKQAAQDEVSRLDALCQVFGLGFVLFDAENPADPMFDIRVRPRKQEADTYYINKYMKEIEHDLFS